MYVIFSVFFLVIYLVNFLFDVMFSFKFTLQIQEYWVDENFKYSIDEYVKNRLWLGNKMFYSIL